MKNILFEIIGENYKSIGIGAIVYVILMVKGFFSYKYLKKYYPDDKRFKLLTDYIMPIPIIDENKSNLKKIANLLVYLSYFLGAFFIYFMVNNS